MEEISQYILQLGALLVVISQLPRALYTIRLGLVWIEKNITANKAHRRLDQLETKLQSWKDE